MNTAQAFDSLARAAHAAPKSPEGGPHKVTEWSLWARVGGGQSSVATAPKATELTRNADGTAHVIVRWGQPWVDDPAHSAVVDAHPGDLISDELISSQNQVFQASPPINADELMSYLKNAHPIAEQGAPELLSSVRDLHREWPLDGDQKAAVVAVLRRHGHLDYAGQAVDRLGRKGYAFSLDHQHGGLPTRTTLIFDAGSGSLLAVEDMLTGSAGKLNVTTPAVVSYTCFG